MSHEPARNFYSFIYELLQVLILLGLQQCAGLDINALLDGAREMDDACKQETENPAADLAAALVGAMQEGRNIHIICRIVIVWFNLLIWYVQLWSRVTAENYAIVKVLQGERFQAMASI